MSDEPLYCMRCGHEECEHSDAWHPDNPSDARYCHYCGCEAPGGSCEDCEDAMGGKAGG